MLLVQQYLETHSFIDLEREHGVETSLSKDSLVCSLNYSMINSKESDLLAQQCRGLILSRVDNSAIDLNHSTNEMIVRAAPFFRFFNYGQGAASNIDWNDPALKVYHKYDGSLMICWYNFCSKQWNIGTRSVPHADVLMDNGIYTFSSLFNKVLLDKYHLSFVDFTSRLNPQLTYMFELISRYNRIVVDYPEANIVFLGARDNVSLQEFDVDNPIFGEQLQGIMRAITHPLTNVQQTLEWVASVSPNEHEGVVVCDSNFNRIKIKNPAYVIANKMRDTLSSSPRNCLELILLNRDDDAIPLLPQEIAENLISLKSSYKNWLSLQESLYTQIYNEAHQANPKDKKTFALTLQRYAGAFSPAFFAIFSQKSKSVKDFIDQNSKKGAFSNSILDKILSYIAI